MFLIYFGDIYSSPFDFNLERVRDAIGGVRASFNLVMWWDAMSRLHARAKAFFGQLCLLFY
jgi:hypothetical protein